MQGSTLGSGLHGWHLLSFGTTQNFHTSTKTSPFEALYGYPPPILQHYIPHKHKLEAVDAHLKSKTIAFALLKQNLVAAHERTKSQADKHWTDREFQERDWLFLKLLPYRKKSLATRANLKLSPRFYGPFQILKRVGQVVYKLDLPSHSKLHLIFHVSCLKPKLGAHVQTLPNLPPMDSDGVLCLEPQAIIQRRMKKLHYKAVTKVLAHQQDTPTEDVTLELLHTLQQQYPHLVGKVL